MTDEKIICEIRKYSVSTGIGTGSDCGGGFRCGFYGRTLSYRGDVNPDPMGKLTAPKVTAKTAGRTSIQLKWKAVKGAKGKRDTIIRGIIVRTLYEIYIC